MSKFTEVRLTLAAFIYGIEIDLKSIIKKYIVPFQSDLSFLNNKSLEDEVLSRFSRDNSGIDIIQNLDLAVEYINFQDAFTIILSNQVFIPNNIIEELKTKQNDLIEITPIRNRVMHTRPLLGGDFTTVYDFVSKLKSTDSISWKTTLETRYKIESDPTYVLTLTIPNIRDDDTKVIHNLPIPDFDETGFIGRKKDVEDIKKLILSNKVVSILGDGGIGKTALAIKVAYDILEMKEKCPFDLIIWTSAKTTMLTSKGIEEIKNSLKNFAGLIGEISISLDSKEESHEEKLKEILEYFELFKTLLIIDNLETIQNEEVREFIREAQMRCNIVITSRIGLGELEFPRKLTGLSENESASLIREIARIRNSDALLKLPQATLINISEKLYFNPLALKWFVNTVQTGIAPLEVLNNKDDLLNFCLSNVYEKLSDGAISILNTLRAARKNLNTAEIIFLTEMPPIDVRRFLNELFTTTLISREISGRSNLEDVSYYITDFARDFLSRKHSLNAEIVKDITKKLHNLSSSVSHIKELTEHNEFGLNALSFRTANERIAAKFLTEALEFSKNKDVDSALKKVKEAKGIVPNYFETYRVSAFIKATAGDLLGAEDDYKLGLDIEPENPRLLYYYAQFLLFQIEDIERALEFAIKVYELRPNHNYTTLLLARCFNNLHEHQKAIDLMDNLLKTKLNSKDKRVVSTDLIAYYNANAQTLIRVKGDYLSAIINFKKALLLFEKCVDSKNLDYKVVKNFSEALYSFINLIPVISNKDNEEYIKYIILKYDSQISLTPNKGKIIFKYNEKFEDKIEEVVNLDETEKITHRKIIGTIIRQNVEVVKPYLFIEAGNTRFYANKKDFLDIDNWDSWKTIPEGQLVSFDIGENFRGACAKNIKIVN